MLLAKEEDILKLYSTNKVNHQKNASDYIKVKLLSSQGFKISQIAKELNLTRSLVSHWISKSSSRTPKSIKGITKLKEIGFIPLMINNTRIFNHLVHTIGLRYADGCIYHQKRNNSYSFYLCFGEEIDAKSYVTDTKKILNLDLNYIYGTNAYYVYFPSYITRLLIHLGSPIGDKTLQNFSIPEWVFKLPVNIKWEFISGLFSGDGQKPKLKKSMKSCESLKISLSAEESIVEQFAKSFMLNLWELLNSLEINASKPKIDYNTPRYSKNGTVTYPVIIRILTKKDNIVKFLNNIKYLYCNEANIRKKEVLNNLI